MVLIISLFIIICEVMLASSLSCLPCCSKDKFVPTPNTYFLQAADDLFTRDKEEMIVEDSDIESEEDLLDEEPQQCAACEPLIPDNCPSGQLAKDVCECCDVCAKAEGEECGGVWSLSGTCADYLFCEENSVGNFMPGICKTKDDSCCEKKVSVLTGESYSLVKKYDSFCTYNCAYRKEQDPSPFLYCFKQEDKNIVCQ